MANNRELFLTWIKNLFYVHCVLLVVYLISLIPFIGDWFNWINTIVSIGAVFCLYKLMPVSERYRKAAIFSGISVGLTLVSNIFEAGLIVGLAIMICNFIGLYQEFYGHADMLLTIDSRLSGKWHTLFNWNLFGGIIIAMLGAPVITVAALLLPTEGLIAALAALLVSGFEIVLRIVYLDYIKRTHDVCKKYEYWREETPVEEI